MAMDMSALKKTHLFSQLILFNDTFSLRVLYLSETVPWTFVTAKLSNSVSWFAVPKYTHTAVFRQTPNTVGQHVDYCQNKQFINEDINCGSFVEFVYKQLHTCQPRIL